MYVQITITPEQLLVIQQLLMYTKLGQETTFGNAATDLALGLDNDFGETWFTMFENEFGTPDISFEFNDNDGMVINIL